MNLFYNPKGVGDVAFLQINPVEGDVAYEIKENVVQLTQDNAVVGFNIFNFSHYFHIQDVGNIKLTEEILNKLQQVISEAGYSYQLDADLSPKFVVGYVKTKEKHPNADKLSILSVDVATEVLQIVCGAPNVEAGQKVVVAKVGAVMPSGMVIKDAQLRGVDSSGMVCSMKELNLPNAHKRKASWYYLIITKLDKHFLNKSRKVVSI